MLAGFLAVAARYPHVELTICTPHDLAGQERRFPHIRWLADDEAVREDALRGADLWLGLGDTPFQLDSGPWFLDHNERERRRCAELGKPMYLLGVGCESRDAAADARSRSLLKAVERVWTRDELSAETLRPFIDPRRLSAGADVANLAFTDNTMVPALEWGVVGLLLAFERREQFDLGELEIFLQRRAAGHTRWLVQEVRQLPYVERWILASLGPEARSRLSVMDADYGVASVKDYLRAFGAPEMVVTSRYHGTLVGAWHGSRVLVVARSAKLCGIAEELGLPQIEGIHSRTQLEAALAQATAVRRDALLGARERARRMCEEFFSVARAARSVTS